MPNLKRLLVLAIITLALVLSSASLAFAQGNGYGSTTISIPGAVAADARGINDSGQIVGGGLSHDPGQPTPDDRIRGSIST